MKILYLLSLIFIYFTVIANAQINIKEECIWWVDYNATQAEAKGTLEKPFLLLKNAISTVVSANDLNKCTSDSSITRVIYIIGSNEVNTYKQSSIIVSDVGEDYQFPILIQAVDRPSEGYKFDGNLLAFNTSNYAVFVGTQGKYTINFQSSLANFTLRGIEFRDGGYSSENIESSVIVTGASTVSFDFCKFTNNTGGDSGALYYNSQFSSQITNCIFDGNRAVSDESNGGGITIPYVTARVSIMDVTFTNNYAANGGGMHCNHQNLILKNINFFNNSAINGGGLYTLEVPKKNHIVWNYLTFKFNNASKNGGGLYDDSSSNYYNHSLFESNTASNGGAVYLFDSVVSIVLTNFNSNTAVNGGGAIYATDESETDKINQLLVKDSNFTMNTASNGGALYCVDAIARFNINDRYAETNTATNSSTNIDYCLSTCVTTAEDCGCPGGCGVPKDDKNPNSNAKIAVAIFLPITLILLGIVVFLLWKTHSKSKVRTKIAPYDEIRLSPASQDTDDQL
ncbi:hypothetical protein DICPUDRAFT_57680 [Dictyostelium purpureum]|uniref:Right handed beta helix domain-containing protein n=1 Tax=Dictyostelium purpureum TaxID=5786 RepID=F0ZX29_DICPU|nr:uncharacterized protein DICPUDRAFT_57680 [Dictyostelium purpureum]EGC31496.1 hypothetical protein DICPUDRAFT_57680 [Dictyostelium purpureum]|eukprot:XP_003291971.1 hypothetical protein DICPUDRAFT_57680 [Dictyostelium purpureum]